MTVVVTEWKYSIQIENCIVPKPLTLYTHLLPHGTTK